MTQLTVAVVGASGIGRHHAKWHAHIGSRVVAFLGSSPERVEATTAQLRGQFGFDGRGYTSLEALLETERPHMVDVCTPDECHFEHARLALAAGCHVLCEKPLVWDATASPQVNLKRAQHLCELARQAGRPLALCSQYAAAFEQYGRVCPQVDPARATSFECYMETLSRGRARAAARVWMDMGPHPLSLILAVWPKACLVEGSLHAVFHQRHAEAVFTVEQEGHRCACKIAVAERDEGPLTRRFAFDGHTVCLGGRQGADGVYRTIMSRQGVDDVGDDFMLRLIEQFTRVAHGEAPEPLVPADVAVRNLEVQVRILQAA